MTNSDELREKARRIFAAGLNAADPARAVREALAAHPPAVQGRILLVAIGKAALAMAGAALAAGPRPARTIIVTNPENAAGAEPDGLPGAEIIAAAHPVPDAEGARAAGLVEQAARDLGEGDLLLALISGGGSALLPAPAGDITLEEKAEVNRLLLASGADIREMNLVRQQLSRLKGGGLLRAAAPARVQALILSDVVGDDLGVIASGPTVAPVGTREEARAVLSRYGLADRVPASVRACLDRHPPEAGAPQAPPPLNLLVGSNARSVAAMAAAAPGAHTRREPLTGDVAEAARAVLASGPGITLFGGETTVRLRGDGLGGRNQELALRVALGAELAGWPPGWVFLSGGTDGRDGPTRAAGGIVDAGTLARMRAAGLDPEDVLARNDSYHGLKAAGDLLLTGATGTNVADLQVLIRPE